MWLCNQHKNSGSFQSFVAGAPGRFINDLRDSRFAKREIINFDICPVLESLSLKYIELSSGTWEDTIEYLSSTQLKDFNLPLSPMLRHKGEAFRSLGADHKPESMNPMLARAIERHIVTKPGHPCLVDHIPRNLSLWRTLELTKLGIPNCDASGITSR